MCTSCSIVQVNLSGNQLCGIDYFKYGGGTYTVEGITAIADALRVSASMTTADLRGNLLDDASKQLLRDAVKDRPNFTLQI